MQRWSEQRHKSGFSDAKPTDMGLFAESCDVILQPYYALLWSA